MSLNLTSSLCIKILKLWLLPIHPAKINFLALVLLHFDYYSIFFSTFDTVLLNYIHNVGKNCFADKLHYFTVSEEHFVKIGRTWIEFFWYSRERCFSPLKYTLYFSP